jgi:hypothetical protein
VLEKADLRTVYTTFCDGLAASSYGLPWPEASAGPYQAKAE